MRTEDDDPVASESESDSEEDELVKLSEPSETAVYNNPGLLDKLGDISWPETAGWIQRLSIDVNQEQEIDVNDDLNRELAFYTQGLEGSRQAIVKFQSMDMPFRSFLRPSDYFGGMVKSDAHMGTVKGSVVAEKRKVEEAEERRKAREKKEVAKEIPVQKQKESAKKKKEEIEPVEKKRKESGFVVGGKDGEKSLGFEDWKAFEGSSKKRAGVARDDRSGGKAKRGGGKGKMGFDKQRKNREDRDSKLRFGGRKGFKKQKV